MPGAGHKVIVVIIFLFISDSSRDVLYDSSLKSLHRFLENRPFSLLFIGFGSGAIFSFGHSSSFVFCFFLNHLYRGNAINLEDALEFSGFFSFNHHIFC